MADSNPTTKKRNWRPPLLAGLIHAALTLLAIPPLSLWPFAFVTATPLIWLAARAPFHFWRDGRWCLLGVAPLWIFVQFWIIDVTAVGFLPLILVQSVWTPLFVWTFARLRHRFDRAPLWLYAPLAWVAVEYIRGELFLGGYAWNLLGHALIESPRIGPAPILAAPGALLGAYFVSFLVAIIAAVLVEAAIVRPLPKLRCSGGIIAAAAAFIAGPLLLPGLSASSPAARVAIVQTNVPQDNKIGWTTEQELKDWARFESVTMAAGAAASSQPKPDLILWPETMMPGITLEPEALDEFRRHQLYFNLDKESERLDATYFADRLIAVHEQLDIPMLIGEEGARNLTIQPAPDGGIRLNREARFNSAYFLTGGRIRPIRYDKIRLTPFGEVMPLISAWPWLERQLLAFGAHGMTFDLDAGKSPTVFNIPLANSASPLRVVTPICFEITITGHVRWLVFADGQRRADLIANLTNDGWFGKQDATRLQHLQISRWRCLELGTPMARAANTGISAFIDAYGNLVATGVDGPGTTGPAARVDGSLTRSIPPAADPTIYARVGPIFGPFALVVSILLLIRTYVRRTGNTPHLSPPRATRSQTA